MERKLASIQIVHDIRPIEGADKIVVVKVLGWECVALKSEFNIGDKCIYFEIDSILPIAPWNDHLRKGSNKDKPLRIRTIRLRGQLSQGLALPLNILSDGLYEVGQDVTELIGVQKWEPYIPPELHGKVKGTRPSWIPKTDEPRLQSEPTVLAELISLNINTIGTMKMDGSSITCFLKDGIFGVTSRNMELLETEDNAFWKAVRSANVEQKMGEYFGDKNIAVQGELCGTGIQGNKMGLDRNVIYFYNLYDIDAQAYLSTEELRKFTTDCNLHMVPIVFCGKLPVDVTIETLLKLADGLNYDNNLPAEGIVWRPVDETYSEVLKGRLSFKTISSVYLLKYNE